MAVSAFLKQQHRPAAAFVKPAAAVLGIGAVGAAAAYLIGPCCLNSYIRLRVMRRQPTPR
ncbi:hypothetical protein RA11412_0575 [Rothia aeria]|uniref:Uncharacterized protein n=1 Tax=Rothia aeria TaxID=172042 RepID=A0A2Z5QXC0_9MICC|nr:hypothetical protein RA11412_0575 [Rothia aeria]